ncbi:hypothetical protein [Prevotella falsenii]|uniref:hypothetical protein n=1 Tax=Prevotella falsenii TaxID=515414 RepID=UPI0012ECBA4D|nr:hypothetical protein [Prevotella falsenii]
MIRTKRDEARPNNKATDCPNDVEEVRRHDEARPNNKATDCIRKQNSLNGMPLRESF